MPIWITDWEGRKLFDGNFTGFFKGYGDEYRHYFDHGYADTAKEAWHKRAVRADTGVRDQYRD